MRTTPITTEQRSSDVTSAQSRSFKGFAAEPLLQLTPKEYVETVTHIGPSSNAPKAA